MALTDLVSLQMHSAHEKKDITLLDRKRSCDIDLYYGKAFSGIEICCNGDTV